jgi:hypothetical protein
METVGPGKSCHRPHVQWSELCLNLNWLKQQNTWRKICRLILLASSLTARTEHQSFSWTGVPAPPVGLEELTPSVEEPHGEDLCWETKVPSRQSAEKSCWNRWAEVKPHHGVSQNKNLLWSHSELLWRMCVSPPHPRAWATHTTASDTSWSYLWPPMKDLQGTGTLWGKFTGTQQPTKVTGNGSQCGSATKSKLHLQHHQRLENIWTKLCSWCIATGYNSGECERWNHCKCEWGEAGQGSVQTPNS